MIMFVLDDPNRLDELLEAWEKAGIGGATIVESTGIARKRKKHIPMRYLYGASDSLEEGHVTLFAVVKDRETIDACLRASEALVGDLSQPHTGIFSAWPLECVKGYPPAAGEA